MTATAGRRLAKAIFAVELVLFGISVWLSVRIGLHEGDVAAELSSDVGFVLAFILFFPTLGVVLATRRPGNPLGWLMLTVGFFAVEPLSIYGTYLLETDYPNGAWAVAAVAWTWVPVIGISGVFVLLLFPDGRPPSPRWRWFAWFEAVSFTVVSLAILFAPADLRDFGYPELQNPLAIEGLRAVWDVALVLLLTIPLGILGAAWSLIVRYRRAGATERLQIRWLASGAAVVAVLYAITMVATLSTGSEWESGSGTPGWVSALQQVSILAFGLLPIAIGVAVLRYKLFALNLVIRKAVVVATIGVFFTAVYLALVGGVGALVQSRSTPTLSFLSAAVVAILFQPALRGARRFADRIVYGRRATPYEVLSEFSARVGETYASEDVLPRMARVVAEAIGATRAEVWLKVGDRIRVAAAWPSEAERPIEVPVMGEALPELPDADATFPVVDRGELLGALTMSMPASEPMDEAKGKLVADLAAQAGLVLRNVGLTEELRRRLDDLRGAQKRLATAQDLERRRIERNIHDGAQQQLVSMSVQLRLAQSLVAKDPAKAEDMLSQLQSRTTETLEDLRDLARGIYPPLLADKGLPAALEAQARKSMLPVEVSADGTTRYPPEVEAAVYFSILEALQNVAKYAEASRVEVRLSHDDGSLAFEVADDGLGFDPAAVGYGTGLQGMADRLAALDGWLDVRSEPGRGTRVRGRVSIGGGAS